MSVWEEERKASEQRGAEKKKARTHQGAEIKKREQAGGKNSRFGICVSEAIQRRRRRRCTNVTRALHTARKKEKSAKDTTEVNVSLSSEIKNGGQTIRKKGIDRLAAAKLTRSV